ncbi:MAG: hypothetical protein ABEJ04_07900 [Halobacteriaceae archaeon]
MDGSLSRRALCSRAGALGLAAVAGCAGLGAETVRGEGDVSPRGDGTPLTAEGFRDYARDRREAYGDDGVWGVAGRPPPSLDPLGFVGAWHAEAVLADGGSPPAASDLAAALYRHPRAMGADSRYRLWSWVAARPEDDARLSGLSLTFDLPGDQRVLRGAPRGTRTDSPVAVALESNPPVEFPLHAGEVRRVDPAEAEFRVVWAGERDGVQSLHGVCEFRAPRHLEQFDFSLTGAVEATAGGGGLPQV